MDSHACMRGAICVLSVCRAGCFTDLPKQNLVPLLAGSNAAGPAVKDGDELKFTGVKLKEVGALIVGMAACMSAHLAPRLGCATPGLPTLHKAGIAWPLAPGLAHFLNPRPACLRFTNHAGGQHHLQPVLGSRVRP